MKQMRLLCVLLLLFHLTDAGGGGGGRRSFIGSRGLHFVWQDGSPFFANGFNAYWLMLMGSDTSQRSKVSSAFRQASLHGLTVARTWAFADGGANPLQRSPGSYNDNMFKGLDFVVSEAGRYGVKLVLSLVNNYDSFGGKKQYVEWARSYGRQSVRSEDDFFTNPVVRGYYKNHVKAVLTRFNTFTGVAYRDDPTIFAWELMNEPRCPSDLSGRTIQGWITEMAAHVKSIDRNHLLEAGLEGFYRSSRQRNSNPGFQVGTDFIANNLIPGIDFATVHSYPDQWLPSGSSDEEQLVFLNRWIDVHVRDATNVLKKPLLFTEFGQSSRDPGFGKSGKQRDLMFGTVYSKIYRSARNGGAACGGMFWQLLVEGMDSYRDGYEIMLDKKTSTSKIISDESRRLRSLWKLYSATNTTSTTTIAVEEIHKHNKDRQQRP